MTSRRTTTLLCLGLGLALARAAPAQSPDVPSGPASVSGHVVHAERPEAAADIEVLLYALSDDGGAGLRATRSDAEGRFRFEGIANDASVVYLVGARVGEIPFGKRFRFEPGTTEQSVVIEVSDPAPDAADVRVRDAVVRLGRGCTHLRLEHVHRVENPGARVVFVPEGEREGAAPLLEVELPEDVEGFESLLGTAGLERQGRRVRFWGPLYPGSQELAFGYGQPLGRETFELGFPQGVEALALEAPRDEFELDAPRLSAVESEGPLARLRAEGIAPGERVSLRASPTPRETSPLRASRAEVWLELDDAALDVNQRVEVVAPEPLPGGDAPLLCLPVPRGARGLRFSDATLSAGLRRDPSGDLALHGPLPEGPTQVALSYRLPASAAGARFEASFDRNLPLLSVLVADTGIVAETERLHRRRPIRSEDRIFLHWEAFGVEASERVELALRPSRARRVGGRWASTGFALLAGLASLGFLLTPLRERAPEPVESSDPAERELRALERARADLEEDLETGKLDPENHASLREELEARAQSLRAERETRARSGHATPAPAADVLPPCTSCREPMREADRFCSQCGAPRPEAAPPA